MQHSPVPGEEQPHAPGHAADQPAGNQLCREGARGAGGHQDKHKAPHAPAAKALDCFQQVEGGDPFPSILH